MTQNRSPLQNFWRNLVFLVGDIHSSDGFPWFTWAKNEVLTRREEIQEALPLIRFGDVGLHRLAGYASNEFIPGFMIHAWVHTDDGLPGKIVEAVSEGVLYQSPIYPMQADYTIILRPTGVSVLERKGACLKAKRIVGQEYDVKFKFDIEHELKYFHEGDKQEATKNLLACQHQLQSYHPAFTCTEVAAYAWWHKEGHLGIERVKTRWGGDVILADTFLNPAWKIVWMSNSVTPEAAASLGMHGPGLKMIEQYRNNHPVKKFDPLECPLPPEDQRSFLKTSVTLRR
ncbi:MAG: hypothetical protein WA705_24460 [Candidatus Ozemobacteraceae bacterium]